MSGFWTSGHVQHIIACVALCAAMVIDDHVNYNANIDKTKDTTVLALGCMCTFYFKCSLDIF
jgi:hypothetical protein